MISLGSKISRNGGLPLFLFTYLVNLVLKNKDHPLLLYLKYKYIIFEENETIFLHIRETKPR